MFRFKAVIILALFGLFPAAPASAQEGNELAGSVKEIFRLHCLECHGGNKTLGGTKILDHGLLLKKKKVVPKDVDGSVLFERVISKDSDKMPPPGQPPLKAEEIELVRKWIAAGAPPYPEDVARPVDPKKDDAFKGQIGIEYVHTKILEDVRKLNINDRRYVRYFSLNHILTSGATPQELQLHRDALTLAVNHLSWKGNLVKPRPVDPVGTIFAIDIRDFGWEQQPFQRFQGNKAVGRSNLNLFDLVLLEYPYGVTFQSSPTFDRLLEEYIVPSYQVRPIPYVRVDWFISTITQPPLYEDMMQMPLKVAELESYLGVDTYANIKNLIAMRAGMTVSGVSRNNRVVERHPLNKLQGGYYWKSFDFRTSKGPENIFLDPLYFHPAGGEMIFSLPNGLQGYYVANGQGVRVEAAPTEIVVDTNASDKIVRNGLACMRCHDQGMKVFSDTVRPAVLRLGDNAGFDKRAVLDLYPPKEPMDNYVKQDAERFQASVKVLLGKLTKSGQHPLIKVSQRFLDDPLHLIDVAGELSLANADGLKPVFKTPQFVGLGMLPLAEDGVIRRDAWEDYYDGVVRFLDLGNPVVPLDGLVRLNHPVVQPAVHVVLTTNKSKKNNPVVAVEPGDKIDLIVENKSPKKIYFELIGTGTKGQKVIVVPYRELAAGQKYKHDTITVGEALGKEQVTLFASDAPYPEGYLLRAEQPQNNYGKRVGDRVVHPFYSVVLRNGRYVVTYGTGRMVKKTIEIETR